MKRCILLLIFFLFLFFLFSPKEESVSVFTYIDEEKYDNYYMNFDDCVLSTNNFLEKFEYLKNSDFKILEIVPYNSLSKEYLFYTDDLEYVHNKFKNDYINEMIDNSKYTTNICIKSVKINASNYVLDEYKSVLNFTY